MHFSACCAQWHSGARFQAAEKQDSKSGSRIGLRCWPASHLNFLEILMDFFNYDFILNLYCKIAFFVLLRPVALWSKIPGAGDQDSGSGCPPGWFRGGFPVVSRWFPRGFAVVSRWSRGGVVVVSRRFRGSFWVVSPWFRGGFWVLGDLNPKP